MSRPKEASHLHSSDIDDTLMSLKNDRGDTVSIMRKLVRSACAATENVLSAGKVIIKGLNGRRLSLMISRECPWRR